jgi:hypothetical protein
MKTPFLDRPHAAANAKDYARSVTGQKLPLRGSPVQVFDVGKLWHGHCIQASL